MTPRDRLAVMLVVLAAGIVLGMALVPMFRWLDAEPSPIPPVPSARPVTAAPFLSLRCANGSPPTFWTRVEAEASMHRAQMALRSAEHFGVWTSLGQRWATIATAEMLEILLCTQGAQR